MNSVFEIIGPAMVGPSSSHTAGAVRIGLVGHRLLGRVPKTARIGLHGSFAATGRGHATDRGLVAGLMGWAPDDERLRDALDTAPAQGLEVSWEAIELGEAAHPNTARLVLDGGERTLTAASVGGGNIEVCELDSLPVCFSGGLDALLLWHHDRPGFLAHVTAVLACVNANIATIRTARTHRGAGAITVIELDAPPEEEVAAVLNRIDHVSKLRVFPRFS